MKTQNTVNVVILAENKIVNAKLKKTFTLFGHDFAIVEHIEKLYCLSRRELIHLQTGQRILLLNFTPKTKSLKSFEEASILQLSMLQKRYGETEFNNVIKSQKIIN